ncbi:MAG: hypothetical protein EOO10_19785 [Chitinophagaceae bacterium]|nr:MAG: hypothetical protein EOO10_19785 [Chitinophagaceae bacterium]
MLQELFNLVKNVAGQSISSNQDIPNEQNDEVVAEATNTVASGLRNIVAGGGAQNLLSLFDGQGKQGLLSNPIVNMMIGHFSNKLINKFGIGPNQANNMASGLIPSVLENLVNKTNDPNDSNFTLDKLLNSITGGQMPQEQSNGGLGDMLGHLAGGQSRAGGGGLMDVVTQLAQGAQSQQQKNGGSLLDLIKGFTGR